MRIAMLIPDNRDEFRRYSDPHPYFGPAPTALLEGLANREGCEIHVVTCVQKSVAAPYQIGPNIFYHTEVVPKWGWGRGGYLGCIRSIRRQLQKIKPDIVHGQGTERYCALAAAFSGFPNVITIHGNMLAIGKLLRAKPGSFYWSAAKLETFALTKTDGVFCNSSYTEDLVRPRAHRTWRVPNAIAEVYFSDLPKQTKTDRPVLVNVGHIGVRKRQVEILAMAAALHAEGFLFEIHFFGNCNGEDPYGREFLRRIEQAENAGYARYLGPKPTLEIVAALDASQGMIHFPSEEAFGLAPAEGLARNLKLFCSRTGGIIDIATGVEEAELIDVTDWNGLRAAIGMWLKNGAVRPRTASAEMRARYHPAHIARRHLQIYREVLGNAGLSTGDNQ
jgi:glycosyltransferase involved in cell wall biosynthesis